jgi:muramoyltetrapeptide carboxypeptidase
MKTPEYLKKGSKIYLVAPSFGCAIEPYKTRLKESIRNLKELGYEIIEGKNIYLSEGEAASNTPQKRGEEIMDAFSSDADLILSVGGGELMDEILPYVDFEKIRSLPPKWFMGFSDNTNLTFTLTTLSGVKTVYGPNAPSFYERPVRLNSKDALRLLSGKRTVKGYSKWECRSLADEEHPLRKMNLTEKKIIRAFHYKDPVEGTMLGGCLDCLVSLCGTKYDRVKEFVRKQKKGIVWFLESCDLNPLGIRRALFQLKEAGWFENVNAFLIGRAYCNDMEVLGMDKYKAVLGALSSYGVPILIDVDLGHFAPSMPFITGAKAKVEFRDGNIFVRYSKR